MQAALVALRPQMGRIADSDELRRDAHPVSCPTHAALQKMRNTEFLPDLPGSFAGGLVLHGGSARDHPELLGAEPRQLTDHLLSQALTEVVVPAAAAEILKRQHYEHQSLGSGCRRGNVRAGLNKAVTAPRDGLDELLPVSARAEDLAQQRDV